MKICEINSYMYMKLCFVFCFVDFIGNLTTYTKLNKQRSKRTKQRKQDYQREEAQTGFVVACRVESGYGK